jgi:hypothetical protein
MPGPAQKNAREKISRLAAGWTCGDSAAQKKSAQAKPGLQSRLRPGLKPAGFIVVFGKSSRAA